VPGTVDPLSVVPVVAGKAKTMKLKQLFTDDDAVSPVIGVILMVAITVILAAVIASFVLGLGQDTGNNSPNASFDVEFNSGESLASVASSAGSIDITHESGDTVADTELFIRGSDIGTNASGEWHQQKGAAAITAANGGSDVSSGSTITVGADSRAYEIRVVWEPPEKDTSSTLSESTGPDA